MSVTALSPEPPEKPAGMTMVKVKSSNIHSIGYSPIERTLRIKFLTGGVYDYFEVAPVVINMMMAAESKGRFFHKFIKDAYRFVLVTEGG